MTFTSLSSKGLLSTSTSGLRGCGFACYVHTAQTRCLHFCISALRIKPLQAVALYQVLMQTDTYHSCLNLLTTPKLGIHPVDEETETQRGSVSCPRSAVVAGLGQDLNLEEVCWHLSRGFGWLGAPLFLAENSAEEMNGWLFSARRWPLWRSSVLRKFRQQTLPSSSLSPILEKKSKSSGLCWPKGHETLLLAMSFGSVIYQLWASLQASVYFTDKMGLCSSFIRLWQSTWVTHAVSGMWRVSGCHPP